MSQTRWKVGSLLQQAVAGVESRLDQMLTEEEDAKRSQPTQAAMRTKSGEQSGNISRSSSNARKNDRLQERLARAMAKNNAPNAPDSSPAVVSPVTSPAPSNGARSSMDVESSVGSPSKDITSPPDTGSGSPPAAAAPLRTSHDSSSSPRVSSEAAASTTSEKDSSASAPVFEPGAGETDPSSAPKEPTPYSSGSPMGSGNTPADEEQNLDGLLQPEKNTAESELQEEIHGYIERIDALQSKLKYLAQEAADSARKAAATAQPGSADRQLREKDERIALLLEEGQKLSKMEMDHRTLIKKLRQQLAENHKLQLESKKKNDQLERDLANAEARAKRAEAAEKRAIGSLSAQTKAARDLEAVTAERDALIQTVQEMKGQLARAVSRADAAEAKANSDAIERERQRANQLEEELSSAKIELEISEEKLKREIAGLKETIEQEKERARVLEVELKGEQSVLESKVESLRSRAEEASSGVAGDAQVKLLRQIETLQTQYAAASENWQALEGSLLSRLSNLEKERDEVARREAEARKKIREVNVKLKRLEEELEDAQETQRDLSNKLEERSQELQKAEQRLKKAADELTAVQNEMAEQKAISDATWAQKLEDERTKFREQAMRPINPLRRNDSPVSFHRPNISETPMSLSDYRPTSRRSSAIPGVIPDITTPPRHNSLPVSASQSVLSPILSDKGSFPAVPESPRLLDPDEFFTGSRTPSAFGGTATHSRGMNDIISESTVGAGPSVQLVERMSATVRRLESERAASKDELARITAQRDQAREQVVELMREVEEKRASDAQVQELQQKLEDLERRYETTLELLGEKSEQVEELQADIADLKKIYRELVDSTMK